MANKDYDDINEKKYAESKQRVVDTIVFGPEGDRPLSRDEAVESVVRNFSNSDIYKNVLNEDNIASLKNHATETAENISKNTCALAKEAVTAINQGTSVADAQAKFISGTQADILKNRSTLVNSIITITADSAPEAKLTALKANVADRIYTANQNVVKGRLTEDMKREMSKEGEADATARMIKGVETSFKAGEKRMDKQLEQATYELAGGKRSPADAVERLKDQRSTVLGNKSRALGNIVEDLTKNKDLLDTTLRGQMTVEAFDKDDAKITSALNTFKEQAAEKANLAQQVKKVDASGDNRRHSFASKPDTSKASDTTRNTASLPGTPVAPRKGASDTKDLARQAMARAATKQTTPEAPQKKTETHPKSDAGELRRASNAGPSNSQTPRAPQPANTGRERSASLGWVAGNIQIARQVNADAIKAKANASQSKTEDKKAPDPGNK